MKSWNGLIQKSKRLTQTFHWQISLTIVLTSILVCGLVLIFRYAGTFIVLRQANTPVMMTNVLSEVLINLNRLKPGGKLFLEPPNGSAEMDVFDINRPSQDWVKVSSRYIPHNRIALFFLNENGMLTRINAGHEPNNQPLDAEETQVIDRTVREILDGDIGFGQQIIFAEEDYALGFVQTVVSGLNGYFLVYITKPNLAEMMRTVLFSSISEFLWLMLFSIFLSAMVGFVFSKRWQVWLSNISQAVNDWSQGDFSLRIANNPMEIAELREMNQKLNRMAGEVERVLKNNQKIAASEERNRLSRELHDNIKQQIFSVSMNLGTAKILWDKNAEAARQKVQLAAELTQDTLSELDRLIRTLHTKISADYSFRSNLQNYVADWEKTSGIRTQTEIDEISDLDESIASEVFRICQESLSNVMRHSHAKSVKIRVENLQSALRIEIQDNGKGFDTDKASSGLGLISIRERTEALYGQIKITSNAQGTKIAIYIPRKMSV